MAMLCEGAKALEVSELGNGRSVHKIYIERSEGEQYGYHVSWEL